MYMYVLLTLKSPLLLCGSASDQQALQECEEQLRAQRQRCNAAKEHLDRLSKTLSTARAGIEHLEDKLQHISLVLTEPVAKLKCHVYHHLHQFVINIKIRLFSPSNAQLLRCNSFSRLFPCLLSE